MKEGQEDDLNFALILVIRPLELGPLDRALGKEGDEPHSLRKLSIWGQKKEAT